MTVDLVALISPKLQAILVLLLQMQEFSTIYSVKHGINQENFFRPNFISK